MHVNLNEAVPFNNALEEYRTKKIQAAEALQKIGQEMVRERFVEFFESNPSVKKIGFTAYTPYFNDGDPCTYGIDGYYYFIEGVDDIEEGEYDFWEWSTTGLLRSQHAALDAMGNKIKEPIGDPPEPAMHGYQRSRFVISDEHPEIQKLVEDMERIESETLDADLCQSVYGDHVKVFITPGEIEIQEYDHD